MDNTKDKFDPTEFGITIRKKNVGGNWYFSGTVAELPDVEVFEDSYSDAYDQILEVIAALKETADESNHSFPNPTVAMDEFSGRVTLRLTKSLHKKSALIADREGVSLNQLFVTFIAEAVGEKQFVQTISSSLESEVPTATSTVRALPVGQSNIIPLPLEKNKLIIQEVAL